MEQLSSKENSLIKSCKALAQSARERREQGLIFLEGLRLCSEALRAGAALQSLLCTGEALMRWPEELAALSQAASFSAQITPQLAKLIAQTEGSQGIYCVCTMPQLQQTNLSIGGSYLLLDRLQDPGNLGSIIRTAEAFGIGTVVLSPDCADLWSPKVLRSTMGSCFRQRLAQVADLAQAVDTLKALDIPVYGAALDRNAVTPAQLCRGAGGIAVVIGNEGNGISPRVLERCSHHLYIPMTEQIESLNAAAAAAILLWELSKQQ